MSLIKKINESSTFIKSKIKETPDIAIILGSGLGDLTDNFENKITVKYNEIPNFMQSTAVGHAGELVYGTVSNKKVIAMKGRFHFYEGYDISDVVFPVRVFKALNVKTLIITNAAGAVNKEFNPGDLMLIKDHINLTGRNPLIGKNYDELGPRFPDLSNVYNKDLRDKVKELSKSLNIELKEGVYAWWTGPTYETKSEVKMMRTLGADACGMSTAPEAITAAHSNLNTIGISCITNMAAGILDEPLSHEDVVKVANLAKEKFSKLVLNLIKEL